MILHGDCRVLMAAMDAESVDAIVTDPPYGLGFMGREWDHGCPGVPFWAEALRVAKPGAHLLAFGGTRTFHRLTCAIEDAGFEIRDCLSYLYGSGFPKSLDVSKAIDREAGAEREVVGPNRFDGINGQENATCYGKASRPPETRPATGSARQWQGWGTALKPAWEPVILARRPLIGTVAANVQRFGTGGINVDGCRIAAGSFGATKQEAPATRQSGTDHMTPPQRWPANVLLDEQTAALLDEMSGERTSGLMKAGTQRSTGGGYHGNFPDEATAHDTPGDSGGASRFFYTSKASRTEREEGLARFAEVRRSDGREKDIENPRLRTSARRNPHPTVKPVDLMRWLCRLVTPPGGLILDPFAGSGSTGVAAILEGFRFVGCEQEAEYVAIAEARLEAARAQGHQPRLLEDPRCG